MKGIRKEEGVKGTITRRKKNRPKNRRNEQRIEILRMTDKRVKEDKRTE